MFSRRVFGSSAIPRSMYTTLRISSQAQARRMLPSLVPLAPGLAASTRAVTPLAQCISLSMPVLETAELDPILLHDYMESISPVRVGFLRLLELWGIGRTVMSRPFN
ncbi:uncharacterized protein TM35_000021420 [Trypanosoma theileri]|uniref:Uncharacterized protein n=1 Tax=Trypanosoma theileri TaxID=67003 RepID=A0A1X0P784_9TRYP|nr:uncharacterized protein TM35_000021420 [Trypanosoma theileri]ORC92816.1 hypothetical protein TM35_000021420 [Trypanosoma theileri]